MSAAAAGQPLAPPQQPVERRERSQVTLHGHAVLSDMSMVEIIVRDLSYDGCGIQSPKPLKVGDKIRLGVLERGIIEAQVRWYANGIAGLVFDPEESDGDEQAAHRERRSERVPLIADVTFRRLGKLSYRVRVFDASTHGCKVEYIEQPSIEELVRIRFEGLQPLDARTCWIEGNQAGLEFEQPIHPAVFDLLVARMLADAERA